MGGVTPDALKLLGNDVRQLNAVTGDYTLVYLNLTKVLFADTPVRRALGLAIDRAGSSRTSCAARALPPRARFRPARGPTTPPTCPPRRWTAPSRSSSYGRRLDRRGRRRHPRPRRPPAALRAGRVRRRHRAAAVAGRLRDDWLKIGVGVDVRPLGQPDIVKALGERSYEAALYGIRARMDDDPDPYPLWHSSQAESGLNFADFSDAQTDQWLVAVRQTTPSDITERKRLYGLFQARFAELQPALLLYHPVYTAAVVDPSLGGIQLPAFLSEPADRHFTTRDWFVRTERIFFRR
ncbi:MAG: hypothetical protein U0470_05005 [Anaerolineae bacterium]